jgi:hypothetical protein
MQLNVSSTNLSHPTSLSYKEREELRKNGIFKPLPYKGRGLERGQIRIHRTHVNLV